MNAPPPPAPSDADLVAQVLAGNPGPFRLLMERHQQAIFGYVYRLVYPDREAAQDLTQGVFLKAYQGLAGVDAARPLRSWLYRIAHNETANHFRSRARRREATLTEEHWADLPAPAGSDPEQAHAEAEDARRVRQAVAALKPRYRQVVTLYYFEEQSYEEIAAAMAVPPGTVATWLRRAKAQLAGLLGDAGAERAPP